MIIIPLTITVTLVLAPLSPEHLSAIEVTYAVYTLLIVTVSPPPHPACLLISCSPLGPTLCLPILSWRSLRQHVLSVLWLGSAHSALEVQPKTSGYRIPHLLSFPSLTSLLVLPEDYIFLTANNRDSAGDCSGA